MSFRWLRVHEYEAVVIRGLVRDFQLSDEQAHRLIKARWPMSALQLPAEARPRGLEITLDDVTAWLKQTVGEHWDDGEPVDPARTWITAKMADRCFEWLVRTGRARPTEFGLSLTNGPLTADKLLQFCKAGDN